MSVSKGVDATLDVAVNDAVAIVDGCDHAAVSIAHNRKPIDTPAASDDIARRGDVLQYEVGEGPCLEAIRIHETVHIRDFENDTRWPLWRIRLTSDFGIRSMLCFQLFVSHDSLGALNLYSTHVDGFTPDDLVVGLSSAAQVAVALTSAQDQDQLYSALASRTVIGQATGMIAQRYRSRSSRRSRCSSANRRPATARFMPLPMTWSTQGYRTTDAGNREQRIDGEGLASLKHVAADKIRNAQLVAAVVFLLAAVSFTFDDAGIHWAWRDNPISGAILAAVSLVF